MAIGRKMYPLTEPNDEPSSVLTNAMRKNEGGTGRDRSPRLSDADRRRIIAMLQRHDMLPAIEFIFSRKGV